MPRARCIRRVGRGLPACTRYQYSSLSRSNPFKKAMLLSNAFEPAARQTDAAGGRTQRKVNLMLFHRWLLPCLWAHDDLDGLATLGCVERFFPFVQGKFVGDHALRGDDAGNDALDGGRVAVGAQL